MRPFPARFYPVVDTVAWVERLVRLGVGTVQLRAKDLSHDSAVALVRQALAALDGSGTALVVNDYWRAAIEAGARHLHLGQEDLTDADVPAIRRAGLSLGLSTHDDAELETALRHDPDYVALGPIYPTTSKQVSFEAQGVARLAEWKRRIGVALTESYAMWPGSSVSGLYLAHPEAHYFGVAKVERDQVEDYAARKDMSIPEVERWLGPVLNYDPVRYGAIAAE